VWRRTICGVTAVVWTAAAVCADAAPHTGFFAPGAAPRSPEVMLYVSHSIGSGSGGARPTFGLRVQQVRQGSNSGDPQSGDPMQHRELLNWQMEARSDLHIADMRVKLGNRVTYDVSNRRFGSPSRSVMQLGNPTLRTDPVSPAQPHALFAHSSASQPNSTTNSTSMAREAAPQNATMHDIAAAAMAALASARSTSQQRQFLQRQGGIAVGTSSQRQQRWRGGFTSAN
jgi:hypothetical protein